MSNENKQNKAFCIAVLAILCAFFMPLLIPFFIILAVAIYFRENGNEFLIWRKYEYITNLSALLMLSIFSYCCADRHYRRPLLPQGNSEQARRKRSARNSAVRNQRRGCPNLQANTLRLFCPRQISSTS